MNQLCTVDLNPTLSFTAGGVLSSQIKNIDPGIFCENQDKQEMIKKLKKIFDEESNSIISYLLNENVFLSVNDIDTALHKHTCECWANLFELSGLTDFLPSLEAQNKLTALKRGDGEIKPFDIENAYAELNSYLPELENIFSKRIDGIFQNLSGEHVTNSPCAFGETIIINSISPRFDDSRGSKNINYIHDLRCVIALIRGFKPQMDLRNTKSVLQKLLDDTGKWFDMDGGTWEMKVYKKGTAHIRFPTEISEALNLILSKLYPNQIAPISRTKKASTPRKVQPQSNMISCISRNLIAKGKIDNPIEVNQRNTSKWTYSIYVYGERNKAALEEVTLILSALSNHPPLTRGENLIFYFDYNPYEVIKELILTGVIPDQASHQFYQSTDRIRLLISDMFTVDTTKRYCEPSAGYGQLATLLPPAQTTCIELSSFNCKVLKSKGYNAINDDFLSYSQATNDRYDLILMNPPYCINQYLLHLQSALSLLENQGELIAVVPSTIKKNLDEIQSTFGVAIDIEHELLEQFEGTSILSVCIIHCKKPAYTIVN